MTTTAQQLAEVDRKLQALCRGPEPRLAARRIMELLDERDRLLGRQRFSVGRGKASGWDDGWLMRRMMRHV